MCRRFCKTDRKKRTPICNHSKMEQDYFLINLHFSRISCQHSLCMRKFDIRVDDIHLKMESFDGKALFEWHNDITELTDETRF